MVTHPVLSTLRSPGAHPPRLRRPDAELQMQIAPAFQKIPSGPHRQWSGDIDEIRSRRVTTLSKWARSSDMSIREPDRPEPLGI